MKLSEEIIKIARVLVAVKSRSETNWMSIPDFISSAETILDITSSKQPLLGNPSVSSPEDLGKVIISILKAELPQTPDAKVRVVKQSSMFTGEGEIVNTWIHITNLTEAQIAKIISHNGLSGRVLKNIGIKQQVVEVLSARGERLLKVGLAKVPIARRLSDITRFFRPNELVVALQIGWTLHNEAK